MDGCRKTVVLAIIFATSALGYLAPKDTHVPCSNNDECASWPFTICTGATVNNPGVCSCINDYVLREQNNKFDCLEEAKSFNDPCEIDDQCRSRFEADAACIQNKCGCSPTAHLTNLKCWKSSKLGDACGDPSNCIITANSECDGICKCMPGYIINPAKTKCLKEATLFNDPCEIDDQCRPRFGADAACIQNKCGCSPTAHLSNLKCWKSSKLGETCGNPNNCIATYYAECNGICKCRPGYIGNPANTKCLIVAQNLGDYCEDSVQCKNAHFAATCQHNVCLCQPGYIQTETWCDDENYDPETHGFYYPLGPDVHYDDGSPVTIRYR